MIAHAPPQDLVELYRLDPVHIARPGTVQEAEAVDGDNQKYEGGGRYNRDLPATNLDYVPTTAQ